MTVWVSNRTETRRADALVVGDRILDPNDGRSILSVYGIERLGFFLYIDAVKRRSVMRKVSPSTLIAVCIPIER